MNRRQLIAGALVTPLVTALPAAVAEEKVRVDFVYGSRKAFDMMDAIYGYRRGKDVGLGLRYSGTRTIYYGQGRDDRVFVHYKANMVNGEPVLPSEMIALADRVVVVTKSGGRVIKDRYGFS